MVPLSKVVAASIIDVYGDIGRTQQLHTHWAARGLKKLYQENLPYISRRVLLPVNKNTNTASLPVGFSYETFVGFIENGEKVSLSSNPDLINESSIEIAEEDICPRCKQDLGICEDLVVTEDLKNITINGTVYQETVTKKLYPNGDYYLETLSPVLNIGSQDIEYVTKKEFIVNFDLNSCGCPQNTSDNVVKIEQYCPDVYSCYYLPCGCNRRTSGTYRIFEETGLLQLESTFNHDKVYVEYKSFLSKINGAYMVPEVAFETLVEWTKFKSIQGRNNISTFDKRWQKQNYIDERRNMEKAMGKVNLKVIVEASRTLPIFDIFRGSHKNNHEYWDID